jgi:uncharacterized membrane protein
MDERAKAIVSALAIIAVNVCAYFDIKLDQNQLTSGLLAIGALLCTIYGIWKNHNFTDAAIEGQKVTDAIKAGDTDASH